MSQLLYNPESPLQCRRRNPSNEIDEIFAGKKMKKPEQQKNDNADEDKEAEKPKSMKKEKKKKKNVQGNEGRWIHLLNLGGWFHYEELVISSSNAGERKVPSC
ncbi:conserved hypothetical protein [Ricinus communis]|uniref:Uncharacterized protein n=1 Tax=Ricinus communis TaxID=3988 RepID=B9S1D6_RICCO|nr:conserved hypothetical protein [Ricinus communis]